MNRNTFLILKHVSPPVPRGNKYRVVEVIATCDGPRWRFTNFGFPTFKEAQAKIRAIKAEVNAN